MNSRMPEAGNIRLHRYYLAAGATLAATPAAQAQMVNFDPAGGLPITVTTANVFDSGVDIDIDNSGVADYKLFYSAGTYGGGFAIASYSQNRVMYNVDQFSNTGSAMRFEYGEVVHTRRADGNPHSSARIAGSFNPAFIDTDGQASPLVAPYQAFRDRQGFIGLAVLFGGAVPAYSGALRISVNADGTELTVHGGLFEFNGRDITQLAPLADGFEDPVFNGYFPDPVVAVQGGAQ